MLIEDTVNNIISQLSMAAKAYNKSKITLKAMKNGQFYTFFHYYKKGINLDYAKRQLKRVVEDKADLYMVINQTQYKATSYSQAEIEIGRAHTVALDIDHIPAIKDKENVIRLLSIAKLLPTSYIFTRNGVQLFYFTGKNYLRIHEYKALNRGFQLILNDLFKEYGYTCDASVCNIAGLVRVPGSLHCKQEPFQISNAVFNSESLIFNPKVVSDMISRFCKDHGLVSEHKAIRRVVNREGNSINPTYYKDCKTVEEVLVVIFNRRGIRNESMSCRHIADILNENGVKISKSTVARKLCALEKDGKIYKTKDSIWIKNNPSACRGAEYTINIQSVPAEYKEVTYVNPEMPIDNSPVLMREYRINKIKDNNKKSEKYFKDIGCILRI